MRVLFFAPHPDDMEIFAPGTVIKHSEGGDEVIEIIMSYGEKSALDGDMIGEYLASMRREEGKRGAEIMGVKEVRFLGYEDLGVADTENKSRWWTMSSVDVAEEDVRRIRDIILEIKSDLIYAPSCKRSPYRHKDHLATGQLVLQARRQMEDPPTVRMYHGLFPNLLVDVTEYLERVAEAQAAHRSQQFLLRPLEIIQRIYTRLLGMRKGCKYAEGFIEIRPR